MAEMPELEVAGDPAAVVGVEDYSLTALFRLPKMHRLFPHRSSRSLIARIAFANLPGRMILLFLYNQLLVALP